MKRGILHRTTGLARTKRLRPMSRVRWELRSARLDALREVFDRDGARCCAHGVGGLDCAGPLDGHEPLSRSRGGDPYDPATIVIVCRVHHDWIHLHPADAAVLGLRIIAPVPAVPPAPPPAGPGEIPADRSPGRRSGLLAASHPGSVGGSVDEYEREQC